MSPRAHWRLWQAKTVPATALLLAFGVGVVVAVPPTLWLGVGRREVVRLVPAQTRGLGLGRTAAAVRAGSQRTRVIAAPSKDGETLTPVLRQSLRDVGRWATPSTTGRRVEAFLAAQRGAGGQRTSSNQFPAGCAPDQVVRALDRQLAIQTTIKRSRLSVHAFGTRAFDVVSRHADSAVACLQGALRRVSAQTSPSRVELIRLLARLATTDARHDGARATCRTEAARAVAGDSDAAAGPVYALHAYLAVQDDLAAAGQAVRDAVRAQRDPAVQAALREVVSRRFSTFVTQWTM